MIRVAIVGDIGSGKSHIAKLFNYPVFNADEEVAKIYKTDKNCFKKLKRKFPQYISSPPLKKEEIIRVICANQLNLRKITNIIHPEIKKKLQFFLKKNKKKLVVILDIPLFLENNLNQKKDIIIFIQSQQSEIKKRLKKRKNFDLNILNRFKKNQFSLVYKKKKSNYIIKNNFTNRSAKLSIKEILKDFIK